ncbi:MAG: hypothetical protein RIC36_08370 [Rhodospirillales bacterium]
MSLLNLIDLANLHYDMGLIGINEHEERIRIAYWLYSVPEEYIDPREEDGEESGQGTEKALVADGAIVTTRQDSMNFSDEDAKISLRFNGWIFTKADPDPYPSTPHGHWQNQNQKWPKLDPYNGRVFDEKHKENKSKRLKKDELKKLWNDQKFKDFCRDYLIWFRTTFPYHEYRVPVNRIFRFPHQ